MPRVRGKKMVVSFEGVRTLQRKAQRMHPSLSRRRLARQTDCRTKRDQAWQAQHRLRRGLAAYWPK
ncbi:hypothetical protein XFF6990_130160 [Xanthomonas citri pv. fuscans]|uniref:Uncharacterized protein n=1 Tax=Xanthomonas campestris pv. phaseoli TaxID=317013 RepID=A0A7Z7IZM6_XANCH|nr:hypothetical protein XFF6990_130160 [Xanthomonas citri pv. fuscans]SOO24548.1 hypothetical protein XFF6991_380032 [Xanthomonas phaseoli pv. phaseoli]